MSLPRRIRSSPLGDIPGFSLIELLVVVAILGILAAFVVPAFSNIGQARGVTEAAYQVAAAVDLAREEARTRRSYVWLGIEPDTNGMELRIGAVLSKDGTPNSNATNLMSLIRPSVIQRVALADLSGLDVGSINLGTSDFKAATGGLTFDVGASRFRSGRTITFTPEGEVLFIPAPGPTDGFIPLLAIGIRAARGGANNSDNDAAVIIDGSVGIPRIIRK